MTQWRPPQQESAFSSQQQWQQQQPSATQVLADATAVVEVSTGQALGKTKVADAELQSSGYASWPLGKPLDETEKIPNLQAQAIQTKARRILLMPAGAAVYMLYACVSASAALPSAAALADLLQHSVGATSSISMSMYCKAGIFITK